MRSIAKPAALFLASLFSMALPVAAEYPDKPVSFVVPWPPAAKKTS